MYDEYPYILRVWKFDPNFLRKAWKGKSVGVSSTFFRSGAASTFHGMHAMLPPPPPPPPALEKILRTPLHQMCMTCIELVGQKSILC